VVVHTRRRTLLGRGLLAAAALALAAPGAAVAQPPGPPAPPTGVLQPGQTASSPNVELIANLPKTGPFAPESAFGTDIAFQGDLAYVGNYNGFSVYDVADPAAPKEISQVVCPGAQNDVSVSGDLLFLSTDATRNNDTCNSGPATNPANYWEGIKVFDVSNPAAPQYVTSVETDCGSHTHTLVPGETADTLYLYVSSYSPNPILPDCQPPHDKISIVEVPVANPAASKVISEPVLFPDGGNPGGNGSSATSGCHDITVFPAADLAAGACMGDGVLFDISDRLNPRVINRVTDTTNFAFWHSATFNNRGDKVVFTDELGGGGAPTCNPTVGPNRGANAVYDIVGSGDDRRLEFRSYFKIPREQASTENCVAHNGSLIPVPGRDIMVQAWYQGGISVWDFTNSRKPRELGWFDRGPIAADRLVLGGSWSAYWYNGHIFSSDIQKGFDVLTISDPNINRAPIADFDVFNPQTQPQYRPGNR
jgi:hypothetical protein